MKRLCGSVLSVALAVAAGCGEAAPEKVKKEQGGVQYEDLKVGDGPEVVAWTRTQPWSDGDVGLWGASYMAITQLTTAARKPPGLKAIFPIVPMADSYRDITFSGGQINASFIPLWLGLVTGTSLIPPAYADALKTLIAGASLSTLPDCAHLPHVEQPQAFAREVAQFIGRAAR